MGEVPLYAPPPRLHPSRDVESLSVEQVPVSAYGGSENKLEGYLAHKKAHPPLGLP